LAWHPNGKKVYVSGGNANGKTATRAPIYIFDYSNGRLSAQPSGTLEETVDTSELYWSGLVHHRTKPLLFAANRGTGAGPSNVVVFDTATGKLVERIPVEVNPYALALSDNGQTLYVTNWGSDSVSVIDTTSLRVTGRIAVGDNPNDMALSKDGRLFVSCANDNTIVVIDTKTRQAIERVSTPLNINRRAERMRRGLRPDLPTGLVLFGGEGSTEMLRIAKALNREDSGIQLILLCGKNAELADQLRAMNQRIPMFVQGFTRDVPLYMEIADFFIGKPGPGSISEALVKRLPVIVQRNAWTMAHERYNADWVEEMGVGLVVRNFATGLAGAVRTMLAPQNYERFRARVAEVRNSAVYEIPDLLEGILSNRPPQSAGTRSGIRLPLAIVPR
jgi:YVTN family beta-propeller protein